MTQPTPERHSHTQCGTMISAGLLSYRCTLPLGHTEQNPDDPEPHFAVEAGPSVTAWQRWRLRQDYAQAQQDERESHPQQEAVLEVQTDDPEPVPVTAADQSPAETAEVDPHGSLGALREFVSRQQAPPPAYDESDDFVGEKWTIRRSPLTGVPYQPDCADCETFGLILSDPERVQVALPKFARHLLRFHGRVMVDEATGLVVEPVQDPTPENTPDAQKITTFGEFQIQRSEEGQREQQEDRDPGAVSEVAALGEQVDRMRDRQARLEEMVLELIEEAHRAQGRFFPADEGREGEMDDVDTQNVQRETDLQVIRFLADIAEAVAPQHTQTEQVMEAVAYVRTRFGENGDE